MTVPNTTTQAVGYLEDLPDWREPVEYRAMFRTRILTGRDAAEQRSRHRTFPRVGLMFTSGVLPTQSHILARVRQLSQMQRATVVPVWTHGVALDSMASNVATLARDVSRLPFRTGQYAYFLENGLTAVFRAITGVSGADITLEAGTAAYPAITPPSYTSDCLVYPAILCMRVNNEGEWGLNMVDESVELHNWEEL